jgi:energy-converting hydrogenase Eha subunit H
MKAQFALIILGSVALIALIALAGGIITTYLFNYLFSTTLLTFVFGVAKIGFWRAVTVNFLLGMGRGIAQGITTKK